MSNIDYDMLDLRFQRGEIPLSIYCQLNNKPAWFNYELQHQEVNKMIEARKQEEEAKRKAKEEEKAIFDDVKKQIEKELPNIVDNSLNDIIKGLK